MDILQSDKKRYHVQLFYGVKHGFAVKGDPNDPYQRQSSLPLQTRRMVWIADKQLR